MIGIGRNVLLFPSLTALFRGKEGGKEGSGDPIITEE